MESKLSFKDVRISTWIIPIKALQTAIEQLQNGVRFTINESYYMNMQFAQTVALRGKFIQIGSDCHFLLNNTTRRSFIALVSNYLKVENALV